MTKISFKSLVLLLEQAGHRFLIERCESFTNKTVLRLVASSEYPLSLCIFSTGSADDQNKVKGDRLSADSKKIFGHYDCSNDSLLSMSVDVQTLISKAKQRAQDADNQGEKKLPGAML